MIDAIDYSYYSDWKELRINKEKFVESFIRRFADSVNINKNYKLGIYQIYEEPPAASVKITTRTNDTNFGDSNKSTDEEEIVNRLTGILYTNTFYVPE